MPTVGMSGLIVCVTSKVQGSVLVPALPPAPPAPPQTEPPAPPAGDPLAMHLSAVTLSLGRRSTQAVAAVTLLDGMGQPVPNATITGQWSGLVTGGDGSAVTGADGKATLYSARSSSPGTFNFCVTGASKGGMTYDAGANLVSCNAISK